MKQQQWIASPFPQHSWYLFTKKLPVVLYGWCAFGNIIITECMASKPFAGH